MPELKHVGVLGMRWGHRKRGPASQDYTTSRELKKKHVSELSNDEIRKITTRLQLEKQLKDLSPNNSGIGKRIVSNLLKTFGPQIAQAVYKKYVSPNFADAMNEATRKSHFHNDPNVINGTVVD